MDEEQDNMPLLAYKALLSILQFDANLRASKAERGSKGVTNLGTIERYAFYSAKLKELQSRVIFEALESKKIKRDLTHGKIEYSYMVELIGKKVLTVWTKKDIRSILTK